MPVHAGSHPEKTIPPDELITLVIPFRSADAMQLKNDLAPLIDTSQADFTANASSNTLIITDTAANVRRIVEIVSALDSHLIDAAEVKVFQLQYASASGAAKLINDLFGDQGRSRNQQQQGGFGFPFFRGFGGSTSGGGGFPGFGGGGGDRGGGGGGDRGQGQQARRTVNVNASSDDRTNTVVVTG